MSSRTPIAEHPIYVHTDVNVPYVARIQRVVCPSRPYFEPSPTLPSSPRPPISAGVLARATRGSVTRCVALEEVGVHDENRTPAERDLRMHPYLSGARMSARYCPLVAWINSVSPSKCSSESPSCPPYRHSVWFIYSAASWIKSNFSLTVKRN